MDDDEQESHAAEPARAHKRGLVVAAVAAAALVIAAALALATPRADDRTRVASDVGSPPTTAATAPPIDTTTSTSGVAASATTAIVDAAAASTPATTATRPTTTSAPRTPWRRLAAASRVDESALYVVEPASGRLAKLVVDAAMAGSPVFSPDGLRVAFITADRLEIVGLDGTGRRTLVAGGVRAGELRWSPDGTAIAFVGRDGDRRPARIVDIGGGAEARDAGGVAVANDVDWHPQRGTLAIAAADGVHIVERDGSHPRLLHATPHPVGQVRWSPSGHRLLYASNGRLWVFDPSTGSAKELAFDAGTTSFENRWSPDGTRIAVGRYLRCDVYAVDGGTQTIDQPCLSPAWSPDGLQVVVRRQQGAERAGPDEPRPRKTVLDLAVMRTDGTEARVIVEDREEDPIAMRDHRWRPQGDLIVFTATDHRPDHS